MVLMDPGARYPNTQFRDHKAIAMELGKDDYFHLDRDTTYVVRGIRIIKGKIDAQKDIEILKDF